jgi:hypothetical protein
VINNIFNILYEQLLVESLWDKEIISQDETPFSSNLYKVYELEYKLNALNHYQFNGDPRRLDNIKKQVMLFLNSSAKPVQTTLLKVFEKWLASHAITKPKQWAEARYNDLADDMKNDELFESLIGEYGRYVASGKTDKYGRPKFYDGEEFLSIIANNLTRLPYTKSILEPIYKQYLQEQYDNDPIETMEMWQVSTTERAEKYIEDSELDVHTFESVIYDSDTLVNIMSGYGDIKTFFVELYENLVFPVWYGNWKSKGIDKTRKMVERVYKDLKIANPRDMGNMVAQISIALNTVHQTGQMLDFVEEYTNEDTISDDSDTFRLKDLLDKLTDGKYNEKWNSELKEVGINI